MNYFQNRRLVLLSALGLPLAACVGAGGGTGGGAIGLVSSIAGGGSADPGSFGRFVRLGTICSLHAQRSMNLACGRRQAANALEAQISGFSSVTDGDQDAVRQSMTINPDHVPRPEHQILQNRQLAGRYVSEAWAFATLGAGVDALSVNAARSLAMSRSPAALVVVPFAVEAAQALPNRITVATQIVSRTITYMRDNGLEVPTQARTQQITSSAFGGNVPSELMSAAFTG